MAPSPALKGCRVVHSHHCLALVLCEARELRTNVIHMFSGATIRCLNRIQHYPSLANHSGAKGTCEV